ncbi:hypothetical protein SUGI_1054970 [Cryptomeria japonica]|uniref:multiple organellar RNA editing factor 1, mitochondrial n=1 Tax=Cryptomeria japonica TaxID=3369 RepID=UPI00241498CA|nr:multiple organellar RNA editing factor 1, mitochondrial [Cryptomeria japonica]GLJ49715.1 hypothetical protein SUGI_1054970 [Cryptomeria japonica]
MASRLSRVLVFARGFTTTPHTSIVRSSSPSLVQKILPSVCVNQPFRLLGARFDSHWLITMKFPEPDPPREEKIAAFEQTAANVLGSMEEAKKKIYVVSTTNYTGFKCEFPESLVPTMEKQPGVTWVLPDCYAEPQYRPYGPGDRYNNGVITPDPTLAYTRPSERNDERYMNRRRDFPTPMERNDRRRDQDFRGPHMDGRGPMSPGDRQDNRPPMGGRGPLPFGDRQENRPPMGGRGPLPSGDRQDNRPPMAERGPIQAERRDYMPPRDPIQGPQEDAIGSQGRDPVQVTN